MGCCMDLSVINDFSRWIKLASKTLNNVFPTFLLRIGLKKECVVKTKTIGNFNVKNNFLKVELISQIMRFQYYALNNDVSKDTVNSFRELMTSLCDDKDFIEFDGVKYWKSNLITVLCEPLFEEGNIIFDNMENSVVIDVGANIGDTALYFANQGCEVYAFEAVPDIYEMAIKNVELNPSLSKKIHIFNKAVSDKNETIQISYSGLSSSRYVDGAKKYDIEAISLNHIINELKKRDITPTLLQMDCEGSEFDIIPNSDFSMFKELSIEYHSVYRGINKDVLLDSLKDQGFEIKGIYKAPGTDIKLEDIGIIHAINKNK